MMKSNLLRKRGSDEVPQAVKDAADRISRLDGIHDGIDDLDKEVAIIENYGFAWVENRGDAGVFRKTDDDMYIGEYPVYIPVGYQDSEDI